MALMHVRLADKHLNGAVHAAALRSIQFACVLCVPVFMPPWVHMQMPDKHMHV